MENSNQTGNAHMHGPSKKYLFRIFLVMITVTIFSSWLLDNNSHYTKVKYRISQKIDSFGHLLETIFKKDTDLERSLVFERIHKINMKLENIRKDLLKTSSYHVNESAKASLLYEGNPEYIEKVKNFKCVTTVYLKWKNDDKEQSTKDNSFNYNPFNVSNITEEAENWLLIKKYYTFTASEPLCEWIITGNIGFSYGYGYNYTCNNKIGIGATPTDLDPLYFNYRGRTVHDTGNFQPQHRYKMPRFYYAMQIFTKAIVSIVGEPFCNDLQVKLFDCLLSPSSRPDSKTISTFPFHEEVYVISQRWGEAHFHRTIENIPRLAFFIEFLRKHPSIKILAYDKSKRLLETLETFGLNVDRVVTGWVRTNIAYVPRSTACGTPNMIEVQILQQHNNKYIFENFVKGSNITRNKLLLIWRSGSRRFHDYNSIIKHLNETSSKYGLELVVFRDNPVPSLNDTMVMFYSASVVVGPHGAGLSNLVYSIPGTLVIECLCSSPETNLCYHRTAYALGMRWHGLPSRHGCLGADINGEIIDEVLRAYLRVIPLNELLAFP